MVALLVLLAFWALATVADRVLRGALDRARLDETAASFVRTLTRFTITVVAILTALGELGIDTTSILASLGVMGLTLGFAAQDTLANVISGLFIFWDRPFVIGDLGWSSAPRQIRALATVLRKRGLHRAVVRLGVACSVCRPPAHPAEDRLPRNVPQDAHEHALLDVESRWL